MEGMEIEGKTIDEAIENACSTFQVPREKLNIEIISEGTPGFLGMGAKKALIRASLLTIDMELDTPVGRLGAEGRRQDARRPRQPLSERREPDGLAHPQQRPGRSSGPRRRRRAPPRKRRSGFSTAS